MVKTGRRGILGDVIFTEQPRDKLGTGGQLAGPTRHGRTARDAEKRRDGD